MLHDSSQCLLKAFQSDCDILHPAFHRGHARVPGLSFLHRECLNGRRRAEWNEVSECSLEVRIPEFVRTEMRRDLHIQEGAPGGVYADTEEGRIQGCRKIYLTQAI